MAVEVIKGEDKQLIFKLRDNSGDPFDLTSKDVNFCVKRADDTTLTLTSTPAAGVVVLAPTVLGKVQVDISDTETALLECGLLGIELELIEGADKNIIQFKDALDVVERVC